MSIGLSKTRAQNHSAFCDDPIIGIDECQNKNGALAGSVL
ncbi:hypothetical protein OHAE_387 [Ochrobactrum soli]|uniref:Uncharacterized protein n=1 Tax=Ochrobactrum soli TaxID=2448455 RepID=A0A2P9HL28_9HYPH|nr:hypothetical protein OHAE_387 [[Ochrobactrum] soli]